MAHAKLSPSASKRWMNCPGSVKFIESSGIVDAPSKYAAEGTVAHEIGEKCLKSPSLQPQQFLHKKMKADGFTFVVSQEMIDAVDVYVDFCRNLMDDGLRLNITLTMDIEVKCSLETLKVPGLDGGTSDCLIINHDHKEVWVIDYKHGAGVAVEADMNPQALQYAYGALLKSMSKGDKFKEWTVHSVIVQPRAFHQDGEIRQFTMGGGELNAWILDELLPAAQATLEDDAPLVPGDDQCRFCPVAGQCSALHGKVQETAMAEFNGAKFPDPNTMTVEQVKDVLDHVEMIRSFIVKVEEHARDICNGGTPIPGYKLVRKTTRRRLKDDALDTLEFEDVPEELIYEKKMKGLTELEKSLKKELGKAVAESLMAEITEKPEGDIVIAPEKDRRKAVEPSVVSDFNGLEEQ